MDLHQLLLQQFIGIQNLSKSWPLWQTIHILQIKIETPNHWAAQNGHIEVVKILAPLKDNPNTLDKYSRTSSDRSALKGDIEIAKILAPLRDNLHASNEDYSE